ncbi:MAG: hypothetical protein RR413_06255 [Christensenellaceae bacterium]
MIKKLVSIILALVISMVCIVPAFATVPQATISNNDYKQAVTINPKAEELVWYYRLHNGVYQRRLWNLTWGYWVTEWANV